MPRVLTAQHQQVNRGHPLARGLVLCTLLARGSGWRDIIRGAYVASTAGLSTSVGPHGPSIDQVSGVTSGHTIDATGGWLPTTSATVTLLHAKTDATLRQNRSFGSFSSTLHAAAQLISVHHFWTDGNIYWDFGGNTGANRLTVAQTAIPGTMDIWSFVAGLAGMSIWRNGAKIASQSTAVSRTNTDVTHFGLGNGGSATNTWFQTDAVRQSALIMHARELDAEIPALHSDPFQMLETPSTRRTYILSPQGAAQSQAPRSMHQYRQRSGRH